MDCLAASKPSRSAFITAILHRYLQDRARADCAVRDLEMLTLHAHEVNTQAENVLRYPESRRRAEPAMKRGIYRAHRNERAQSTACTIRGIAFVVEVN
jgi:hypothetical protein